MSGSLEGTGQKQKDLHHAQNDLVELSLNIDNLPGGGLQVKVVMFNSNRKITKRIPSHKESKQLVRQMCNMDWQEASNIIFKHKELQPEVVKALKKCLRRRVPIYIS